MDPVSHEGFFCVVLASDLPELIHIKLGSWYFLALSDFLKPWNNLLILVAVESYCIPNFDSPSVFARILDKDKVRNSAFIFKSCLRATLSRADTFLSHPWLHSRRNRIICQVPMYVSHFEIVRHFFDAVLIGASNKVLYFVMFHHHTFFKLRILGLWMNRVSLVLQVRDTFIAYALNIINPVHNKTFSLASHPTRRRNHFCPGWSDALRFKFILYSAIKTFIYVVGCRSSVEICLSVSSVLQHSTMRALNTVLTWFRMIASRVSPKTKYSSLLSSSTLIYVL